MAHTHQSAGIDDEHRLGVRGVGALARIEPVATRRALPVHLGGVVALPVRTHAPDLGSGPDQRLRVPPVAEPGDEGGRGQRELAHRRHFGPALQIGREHVSGLPVAGA